MPSKFQVIEKERNKSMREILLEEFQRLESATSVAEALGVTQGTVSLWIARCGLKIRQVLVEKVQA